MTEEMLRLLERELTAPVRRMAAEDRSPQQRVDILVSNSYLVQAVPVLVAEVRRLRALLRAERDAQAGVG